MKYSIDLKSLLNTSLNAEDSIISNYLLPKIIKLLKLNIEKLLDYDDYLEIINELTSKEAMVIPLKYGFVDGEYHTSQYIAIL